jgi:electron transfer flavoprotein-quinone oxidoreductase
MMEHIYRIDGTPKTSIPKLILREVKEKVGLKNAISDVLTAWRAL